MPQYIASIKWTRGTPPLARDYGPILAAGAWARWASIPAAEPRASWWHAAGSEE